MGRTACTELQCLYSTAKSLLLPWAILSVQNFSCCTGQLNFYSSYGPKDSKLPKGLHITAIPLLPYGPYIIYNVQ